MNNIFNKIAIFIIVAVSIPSISFAQCCAGGGGNPVSGGSSQGVLQKNQLEVNTNFQYVYTDVFYDKDQVTDDPKKISFGHFSSFEQHLKISYGISKKLTVSADLVYFHNKEQIGLPEQQGEADEESNGFSDLVIFPRYNIFDKALGNNKLGITTGLGVKIPLGKYNDSIPIIPGAPIYKYKHTSVQQSSGAYDFIFYGLVSNTFIKQKFKVFASVLYINKGYNPNDEKLGNFTSVSLFASKTYFKKLGVTLEARYENMGQMDIKDPDEPGRKVSNQHPEATGFTKMFIVPRLSYTIKKFSFNVSYALPLYQNLNSADYYAQSASQYQITFGASYRFFTKEPAIEGDH